MEVSAIRTHNVRAYPTDSDGYPHGYAFRGFFPVHNNSWWNANTLDYLYLDYVLVFR